MKYFAIFVYFIPLLDLPYFVNKPSHNMGMSYFIHPNKQTNCINAFGDGLSVFFGQVGGYGEKAEAAQVSHILEIDLAVFQDVGYDPENQDELNKHWHDIDTFTTIIDSLIARIKSHPDYHKKVIYNPNKQEQDDQLSKSVLTGDKTKLYQILEEQQKQAFYGYPADHGYLSEGRLLEDLQILRKTIECYKKSSVTKVRLEYL